MMRERIRRTLPVTAAVATASALALSACSGTSWENGPKPAASPTPAVVSGVDSKNVQCRDARPAEASIAPGKIGVDPSTWPGGSTMEKIRFQRKELVVGTSGDVRLWGARDPQTGRLEGFDIDVLQQIAHALGVKVVYKVINYGQRLPDLKSRAVDVVADQMTINCDRWQGAGSASAPNAINFSSVYYESHQKVLIRHDPRAKKVSSISSVDALKGQTVCVVAGSTSQQNIASRVPVKDQVVVNDLGDCLVKFQEGEATAITGDDTVLAGFAAQDPYSEVVGDNALSDEPYGIGVKAGDTQFTQFINAVLEEMRQDGELTRIYRETMGKALPGVPAPTVPQPIYGRNVAQLDQNE